MILGSYYIIGGLYVNILGTYVPILCSTEMLYPSLRETLREGRVFARGRDEGVLVQGAADMNRAVDGDVVAVQMLPESDWKTPLGKLNTQGCRIFNNLLTKSCSV